MRTIFIVSVMAAFASGASAQQLPGVAGNAAVRNAPVPNASHVHARSETTAHSSIIARPDGLDTRSGATTSNSVSVKTQNGQAAAGAWGSGVGQATNVTQTGTAVSPTASSYSNSNATAILR